jgi:hypothetical protein
MGLSPALALYSNRADVPSNCARALGQMGHDRGPSRRGLRALEGEEMRVRASSMGFGVLRISQGRAS